MDSAASGIAAIDPAAPDSREALLIGAPPAAVPDTAARASPVTYAHAGAPPFLIAHGTADRLVPYAQSQRLADALTGHGVPVELVPYDGADHMWRGMPEVARAAFTRSRDFVLDRLAVRR